MENVVPWPGVLSTAMYPRACWITPRQVANPSPVPRPSCLVVKNGSKMRASGVRVHADTGVLDLELHERAGRPLAVDRGLRSAEHRVPGAEESAVLRWASRPSR